MTPDGNGIGATITAEDANGPLPTDNPYQFFNPPLGIVIGYYGDGEPIIDTSEVLNAAKAMVYDAVTFRARQLGWSE
jgi:hypothetical protein